MDGDFDFGGQVWSSVMVWGVGLGIVVLVLVLVYFVPWYKVKVGEQDVS